VVGFTIGSRGKVLGKTRENRRNNNNSNNNNNNNNLQDAVKTAFQKIQYPFNLSTRNMVRVFVFHKIM
jgi:hypothetical protein